MTETTSGEILETVGCMAPLMLAYLRSAAERKSFRRDVKRVVGISLSESNNLREDYLLADWNGVVIGVDFCWSASMKPFERNMLQLLSDVAEGIVPAKPKKMTMFGPLRAAALEYHGFSPLGVQAVIEIVRHLDLWSDGCGRLLMLRMSSAIVLGRRLTIESNDALIVNHRLPETVIQALPGRKASDLVDHPFLRNFMIDSAKAVTLGVALCLSPWR